MLESFVNKLIEKSKVKLSDNSKFKALIIDEIFFILIVPWFLLIPAYLLINYVFRLNLMSQKSFFGLVFVFLGLVLSISAVITQWKIGKGTPSLNAPTEKLVIKGVYKLCRNPIQLGALIYILGLGIVIFSISVGILGCFAGLIFGIFYIKLIEEKELEIRFERDYLEYKLNTPFIIPTFNSIKNYLTYK